MKLKELLESKSYYIGKEQIYKDLKKIYEIDNLSIMNDYSVHFEYNENEYFIEYKNNELIITILYDENGKTINKKIKNISDVKKIIGIK